MKSITMVIDEKQVTVPEGATILEAASQNEIRIPTLCHNDQLKSSGACRMCMVEIRKGETWKLVASCVYPAEEGLVVRTQSERILKIRKMIVELLWPAAQGLAAELGVTSSRFRSDCTDCTLCGLCVRYCSEIKHKQVAYFHGRGIDRRLTLVPELASECVYCGECFGLCASGGIVNAANNHYGAPVER